MVSHANSNVLISYVCIESYTVNTESFTRFIKTLGTCKTIPIFKDDVVYDFESTGKIIILYIHNLLYFKGMRRNLISPLLMILDGLEVDECLKLL